MAPEHVQKAFWVLANKIGKEEFDSSAPIVFWFLSFIFKVRICIVRVSKSKKSKGQSFDLKKEIICCWRSKDVVDEIILNHSSKLDTKARDKKGYEYSILVNNNVMSLLADKDLHERIEYIETMVALQKKELDDGKKARKLAPVLEEESTNDKETNANEAKKRSAESDDEQSNKKKKIDDNETNIDDPNKEMTDKDRDQTNSDKNNEDKLLEDEDMKDKEY